MWPGIMGKELLPSQLGAGQRPSRATCEATGGEGRGSAMWVPRRSVVWGAGATVRGDGDGRKIYCWGRELGERAGVSRRWLGVAVALIASAGHSGQWEGCPGKEEGRGEQCEGDGEGPVAVVVVVLAESSLDARKAARASVRRRRTNEPG